MSILIPDKTRSACFCENRETKRDMASYSLAVVNYFPAGAKIIHGQAEILDLVISPCLSSPFPCFAFNVLCIRRFMFFGSLTIATSYVVSFYFVAS